MLLYHINKIPGYIKNAEIPQWAELKSIENLEQIVKEENTVTAFITTYRQFIKLRSRLGELLCNASVLIAYHDRRRTDLDDDPLVFDQLSTRRLKIFPHVIDNMYKRMMIELKADELQKINKKLLSIGVALSAERDNNILLDDILRKTREITKADAGSLYLLEIKPEDNSKWLLFKIAHNDSNPKEYSEFKMELNKKSIAGYVAETSEILNIPDVYEISGDTAYSFNRDYDIATSYRSKSMLTVPMLDHNSKIIGVIQLINRKKDFDYRLSTDKDFTDNVIPFTKENEDIVLALAGQAAVSLENNILYNEIQTLFKGFVWASVKAIESRDPTTSGHSSRVAAYSLAIAEAINQDCCGDFADIAFSEDQLKELEYAGLLHDFGKVGVSEPILIKAKKLYPGQLELLKMRFAYIKNQLMQETGELVWKKDIDRALITLIEANEPGVSVEELTDELEVYRRRTYTDVDGKVKPWITNEEYEMLLIEKGNLNELERREIESHVVHSYEFLINIPWTDAFKNLPKIARAHHERMDGSGYPDGLTGEEMPLQSMIMAVADVFDALTANDRPYKPAIPVKTALDILKEEADANHLNSDVVNIFIDKQVYKQVMAK